MSSYVVDKNRYIQAAGILAGIASETRNCEWNSLRVFDYERGKVMESADYYDRFVECFEMNAFSVQERYADDTPYRDDHDYKDVFAAYIQKGRKLARGSENLRKAMYILSDFFREVDYQMDKDVYRFKMQMLFGRIIMALVSMTDPFRADPRNRPTIDNI